ncbi:MAG TPA: hypothetical protein VG674_05955, partial [Amycolatopsis sp.]|nr:hypothetical protein [Amycolatopsis sp.]
QPAPSSTSRAGQPGADTTNTAPDNATTSDDTDNQHPITNYNWSIRTGFAAHERGWCCGAVEVHRIE